MSNKEESIQGLVMLKLFTRKVQRALLHKASRRGQNLKSIPELEEEKEYRKVVPNDVKKGQFAVTAIKDGKAKRFTVELDYLNDPEFLSLLELAEEEFGFRQEGVLAVPCHPEELQKILRGGKMRRTSTDW
ncbi:Auxin-responsive protein SAUR32 [Linum perenne]